MSFSQALAFTLKEEGGYVDDPMDHGGATNHGITQSAYDIYRLNNGLGPRSVRNIEDAETTDLYRNLYWIPARCGELETRLGICHFDWAVNHGVVGAVHTLQEALGVAPDGMFGSATAEVAACADAAKSVVRYLALRRAWYLARVKAQADQRRFLAGWLARVDRLQAYLEKLT